MTYPWRIYPALEQKHLKNARLSAHRNDMIASLDNLKGGKVIAEIGVAQGDFSEILLRELRPSQFVAFDLFNIHEWPSLWGKKPSEIFGNKTHPEFYRDRFADQNVVIAIGRSWDTVPKYPDNTSI